jgi:hypothetical protein
LNNLLERFHQSFFFYLLPAPIRYVSIGLYMPPFCCLLLGPLVSAIVFWILAGDPSVVSGPLKTDELGSGEKNENRKIKKIEGEKGVKPEGEERHDQKEDKERPTKEKKSSQATKEIDESILRQKVCH